MLCRSAVSKLTVLKSPSHPALGWSWIKPRIVLFMLKALELCWASRRAQDSCLMAVNLANVLAGSEPGLQAPCARCYVERFSWRRTRSLLLQQGPARPR